jgi:hypothetical protein
VGAYYMDVFTQLWVNGGMVVDVARLDIQNPDYQIWVGFFVIFNLIKLIYLFNLN